MKRFFKWTRNKIYLFIDSCHMHVRCGIATATVTATSKHRWPLNGPATDHMKIDLFYSYFSAIVLRRRVADVVTPTVPCIYYATTLFFSPYIVFIMVIHFVNCICVKMKMQICIRWAVVARMWRNGTSWILDICTDIKCIAHIKKVIIRITSTIITVIIF